MLNNDYSYRDAANLLDAVKQLLTHFMKYTSIPMICEIKDKLEDIQTDLRKHVHRAFREIGQVYLSFVINILTVIPFIVFYKLTCIYIHYTYRIFA